MKTVTAEGINTELDALDTESARLKNERSFDALAALQGDKSAQKRLAEIDVKLTEISNRRLTLLDGLTALEQQLKDRLDGEERARRMAKADRIEAAIAIRDAANLRLDEALDAMAGAIKGWLSADREMAGAGVLDRGQRPYIVLTRGIYHALQNHLDQAEFNQYSRLLLEVFPRNLQGNDRWSPVANDAGIAYAQSQIRELRE